jgi:preprotein translocase subunit SecE
MARNRPAKSGDSSAEGGAPAPSAAGGGRGKGGSRRSRAAAQAPPPPKQGSYTKAVQVSRGARFIGEVATELRKVTWPTRTQLFQATGVVLVFVAIVTAYLALLDEIFARLIDVIF